MIFLCWRSWTLEGITVPHRKQVTSSCFLLIWCGNLSLSMSSLQNKHLDIGFLCIWWWRFLFFIEMNDLGQYSQFQVPIDISLEFFEIPTVWVDAINEVITNQYRFKILSYFLCSNLVSTLLLTPFLSMGPYGFLSIFKSSWSVVNILYP